MIVTKELLKNKTNECTTSFWQTLLPEDMDVIHSTPVFMEMSDDELNGILDESSLINLPCGERLFVRDEQASSIYLVLDGGVKIYRDAHDDRQAIIEILTRGEFIAEAAIFLNQGYLTSAEVVSDARLLEIPSGKIRSLLHENNDLAIRVMGVLYKRQCDLVFHIEQIKARSTSKRLGDFLLKLCTEDYGSEALKLPYSKSTIAACLGMKPESLSRAMIKLKNYGVSISNHDVALSDVAVLKNFCKSDF